MDPLEQNKAVVRRYYQEAPRDPRVCDEIFAPVFLFHTIQHASLTAQTVESSPESEKESYAWLRSVWGNWSMEIDEMIAEDDRVVVRWTFHGTQQGEFMDLPPTNRAVCYSGINIFRIADGRIAEVWDLYDRLWLWQQLGVLPAIQEAVERTKGLMHL